jgi:DNA polymerase elongation subunit (family B)
MMEMETKTKDDLKKEIERLTNLKNELKNEEQAVKLTMNSIYGAVGNSFFVCQNPDVAEAVTLQGQDLIKFAEKIINRYFNEHWHIDKELHEKIGLTEVRRIARPLVIYIDTDSNYVSFEEVVKSCDWNGTPMDLILKINEYRINDYLKNCLNIYAKKWGTENCQDFELETLSHNAIFLGKKKYVVNLAYDSGITIQSLKELKFTGVEMVKGGTPPFVREKLIYLTKYIFSHGSKFELKNFVKEIKDIKKEFKIQEPDRISAGITSNNYEKFILNDSTSLEVAGSCPIHVRASGFHNFLLNNSKYKSKYPLIQSGEKVRWYFVKTKKVTDCNVFAYSQGTYPYEFAPAIDYDMQFTKTILDPINRFIEAMGHNPISPNLFTITALF